MLKKKGRRLEIHTFTHNRDSQCHYIENLPFTLYTIETCNTKKYGYVEVLPFSKNTGPGHKRQVAAEADRRILRGPERVERSHEEGGDLAAQVLVPPRVAVDALAAGRHDPVRLHHEPKPVPVCVCWKKGNTCVCRLEISIRLDIGILSI